MKTLESLVRCKLLQEDEEIYFCFKLHTFVAQISDKGLLYQCIWKKPNGEENFVFFDRAGFSSLTSWTDSCIQELLHEYVTRFSSWKRVKCLRTNTPLGALRETGKLITNDQKIKKPSDFEKELYKERKKNIYLTQQLQLKEMKLESLKCILSEYMVATTPIDKGGVLDNLKKEMSMNMGAGCGKNTNTSCVFKIACDKKTPVPINRSNNLVHSFEKKTYPLPDTLVENKKITSAHIMHLIEHAAKTVGTTKRKRTC